jgi:hypothetical protein
MVPAEDNKPVGTVLQSNSQTEFFFHMPFGKQKTEMSISLVITNQAGNGFVCMGICDLCTNNGPQPFDLTTFKKIPETV